jgi:hypothetical protein
MRQIFEEGPEENRRSVEREFWSRHQHKCEQPSQYKPLLDAVVRRVRALAEEQDLDSVDYETKLREAEVVLEDVTNALRANWKDPPDGQFWYGFHDSQLIERPKAWRDASPISPRRLDEATARYLERPWLQFNRLDWFILMGFVLDALLRLMDDIKSGTAFGTTNWAYVFSQGRNLAWLSWGVGFWTARFAANWLLLPASAGVAYYLNYIDVAKWIIGLFVIVVIFRIIFLPSRFIRWRMRRRRAAELTLMLKRILQIYQSVDVDTLNPTLLRERIATVNSEVLIRPAVYSILDRAISRDPAVFTISG